MRRPASLEELGMKVLLRSIQRTAKSAPFIDFHRTKGNFLCLSQFRCYIPEGSGTRWWERSWQTVLVPHYLSTI